MKNTTFERALHQWDKWQDSIERSRAKLGYDPKWQWNKSVKWIVAHYALIAEQAKAELAILQLPLNLQQYWEDCFYSDFRDAKGNVNTDKIKRRRSARRSLPDLPCSWGLVWHENEDIRSPWLRVELRIDARFATQELYDFAAACAYPSILSFIENNGIKPHPVSRWLKGGRPRMDHQMAIRCARLKDEDHLTYKKIGELFGWQIEEDPYRKLTQCSKAKRYVKLGRELLAKAN